MRMMKERVESRMSEIVAPDGRAYHLGLSADELAHNVFLVGDPARAAKVASFFDHVLCEVSNREYRTYTGSYRGMPVSVIGTGIGADNVEIAFLEAYVLNEFNLETKFRKPVAVPLTLIRLGTSGGVQPDVPAGPLVISDYALGLDSTGIYYDLPAPDDQTIVIENEAALLIDETIDSDSRFKGFVRPYASKASSAVTSALKDAALESGVSWESGITVTSPGFYGPSSRFIDGFSNTVPDIKITLSKLQVGEMRVLNMEMESSLLFHLARAVGYQAGTICPVISNPLKSDSLIDYEKVIDQTIAIGLDAMTSLRGKS